jgi:hypothetical protein
MIRIFFAFVFVVAATNSLKAQWVSDSVTNTPVCTATNIQQYPKACSDGANGAIVVWEDVRAGYRVYAQKLDASGRPQWTTNGVLLCRSTAQQRYPVVASDNKGGAYVAWQDSRNITMGLDIYAQHISAAGTLQFDTLGKLVAGGPGDQTNQVIAADGFGNAFVAWQSSQSNNQHIFINRLTPTKVQTDSLGWGVSGNAGVQRNVRICEDGAGGCYTAWENSATDPASIYAMRTDSTLHNIWNNIVGIFQGTNGASVAKSSNVAMTRDGNEVMFAWETTSPSGNGQDVYANRVRSNGTLVYYTYKSAIPVASEMFGDQTAPQIFSDDSVGAAPNTDAGILVLFQNKPTVGTPTQKLVAVRVLPDGSTRVPLSTATPAYYQVSSDSAMNGFSAVKVSAGNVLALWNEARGDSSIFAQRIDRLGFRYFPAYKTASKTGKAICFRSTQSKQVTLVPRTNGAIAVWTDYRNGNADIYVQLVFMDGSLPIELSSFNATATRHGAIDLRWETANENACAGFEIQKRRIRDGVENAYTIVASYATDPALRASGYSDEEHSYSYQDRGVEPGIYEYRLIDISLDGTRRAHEPKLVNTSDITDGNWSLGVNQPNPFQSVTRFPITLATDAIVTTTLFDVSGRPIPSLSSYGSYAAGTHTIEVSMTDMPSGTYFIRVAASDPESGAPLWHAERAVSCAR